MSLLIALDLGTTSVRALVVHDDGQVLARSSRRLGARFPEPGWLEQDPDEWWERSVEAMREALAASGHVAREISGIGVVTQRASTVAWDSRTRRPLAPAIGWQDRRNEPRVRALRELGLPINTLASATKLEWWIENSPDIAAAATEGRLRFGTPDSWLTDRLTDGAAHVTDPGHASCTALYDPSVGAFAPALCELFHVPFDALPDIAPSSAVVGETPAELLGAPIPVAARAGDQQASAFAQAVHSPGQAKLTLGTSAMLDVHAGASVPEAPTGTYPLVLWQLGGEPLEFCLEGTVITAGSAVEWLVELGLARDGPDVSRLAESVSSQAGVVFVPALQGLGTPWLDESARGILLGLTRGSGRAEIARAVLFGIAARAVDLFEALALERGALGVDGGLARSDVLLQEIADLSGRELRRAAETETTAMGAALLAGLAVGVYRDRDACGKIPAAPRVFRPRTDQRISADARRNEFARAVERSRS